MNGLIMMLQNVSKGTWHPIMYVEKYLPGDGSDTIIRYKSKGHHTSGFPTREEALATIPDLKQRMLDHLVLVVNVETDADILWSGEELPLDIQIRPRDKNEEATPI